MSVYVAVDYGKKRIGLAYCDESETFCFGIPTLVRPNNQRAYAVEEVLKTAKSHHASALVVGLPVNMDGTLGFMAEAIYDFIDALLASSPLLCIYTLDERLTSKIAAQKIRESGKSPSRDKGRIDEEAARQILEDFLRMTPERREARRYRQACDS
jgi:putative Holliday junction resolvase